MSSSTLTLPAELTREMWAACGDAIVALPNGGMCGHDLVTAAVWAALKRFDQARPAETAEQYNARFDPAHEAGLEIFAAAFKIGWLARHGVFTDDDEDANEAFRRNIDGVEIGEAWDAHRDAFFARLPLAAVGPRP